MNLETQIKRVISAKSGNKEFALFCENAAWTAMVGNPTASIRLGETDGEFVATGGSALEAVSVLLAKVKGLK
ncbi:MAG: hypothetical protein ACTHKQ_05650 [Mesorhizobium sp.]